MIFSFIMQLLFLGLILILLMGLFSPLESMGWWAGWSDVDKDKPKDPDTPWDQETQESTGQSEAGHYVVYLSGIGAIAGDFLEKEEIARSRYNSGARCLSLFYEQQGPDRTEGFQVSLAVDQRSQAEEQVIDEQPD